MSQILGEVTRSSPSLATGSQSAARTCPDPRGFTSEPVGKESPPGQQAPPAHGRQFPVCSSGGRFRRRKRVGEHVATGVSVPLAPATENLPASHPPGCLILSHGPRHLVVRAYQFNHSCFERFKYTQSLDITNDAAVNNPVTVSFYTHVSVSEG